MVENEKISLGKIVKDSVIFAAVSYPVYSMVSALYEPGSSIVEKLTDRETVGATIGFAAGHLIYHGAKELIKKYKITKR